MAERFQRPGPGVLGEGVDLPQLRLRLMPDLVHFGQLGLQEGGDLALFFDGNPREKQRKDLFICCGWIKCALYQT